MFLSLFSFLGTVAQVETDPQFGTDPQLKGSSIRRTATKFIVLSAALVKALLLTLIVGDGT